MKASSILVVAGVAVACTLGAHAFAQDATKPGKPAATSPAPKPRAKPAAKPAAPGTGAAADGGKPESARSASGASTKTRGTASSKPTSKPGAGEGSAGGEPGRADGARSAPVTREVVERESHIEFDERAVRGQTAAGAIYLFQRAPSEFKTIVQVPESFRARTVELLAPRRAGP